MYSFLCYINKHKIGSVWSEKYSSGSSELLFFFGAESTLHKQTNLYHQKMADLAADVDVMKEAAGEAPSSSPTPKPSAPSSVTPSTAEKDRVENLVKIDNLAASQYRTGNFKEAAELLRRALTIREEFLAPDNIDLLNNVNNLAASLGRLKKFDEAGELFRRVLQGREESLGSEHMDTLVTANHLGVVIKQQWKLLEAEPLLLRALAGLQKIENTLPANGLLYAEAAYNYAVLCVQMGKRKKAAKYFGVAHERLEKALGPENPHTLDALHWEVKCMKDVDFKPVAAGETDSVAGSSATETEKDNLLGIYGKDEDDEESFVSKATWVNMPGCELCNRQFTTVTLVRPHHCRICSRCVCDQCSKMKTVTKEFGITTPVRCCDMCEQQGF